MKRIAIIGLICILAIATLAVAQEIKNPDTLIYMSYGTLNSMDPAYCYDTDSGGVIFQVYENLFMWPFGVVDGNEKALTQSLATNDLLPMLGTVVPSYENGLVVQLADGKIQYTVPVRQNVAFHEGGTLTASDVEYTFERAMLQDRRGGPLWMFFEAFSGMTMWGVTDLASEVLGRSISRPDVAALTADEQTQVYAAMADWVSVSEDGDSVIFTLDADYPPFLGMLAHGASWGAILDREWVIEQGGWDADPSSWAAWYNPGGGTAADASELYDTTNGTGPYKLVSWDPGVERVYEAFDGYWREQPAMKTVIHRQVQEWTARYLAYENGDADIVAVDPQYVSQVAALDGVQVYLNLPRISMNPAGFFTTDIHMDGNPYVGSGKLAEDGIPSNFFNDIHVRRAFNHAFNAQLFIDESLSTTGGHMSHGPVPDAFEWAYNPDPAVLWNYDPAAAEAEFKLAHNGQLWDTGFTITLTYNEGNDNRRTICEILEYNIESLNPKFHIEILAMPWSNILDEMVTTSMPFYLVGWLMDYPDPHNFAQPFCQAYGGGYADFSGETMVGIYEENFNPLIAAAMQTTNQEERAGYYYKMAELSKEYATNMWFPQSYAYRVVRDYVQNWPFNPAFPDVYFYEIYKAYE